MTSSPVLRVLDPGPALLVQDQGRPGWAHLGVPTSGAADPDALALANRLVGNGEDAAGLEMLLGPVRLRTERSTALAVTGAIVDVLVDARPAPWGSSIPVRSGTEIDIRSPATGLRSWIAIAGGLDALQVFGSSATDRLTGLGPEPLIAGDVLVAYDVVGSPSAAAAVPGAFVSIARLRIDLGPRHDWFTDEAIERLTSVTYLVTPRCDRVGVRLESRDGGELARRDTAELESEGLVTGAVQVPPSGQPLVFLADHPVTGGFPVIAVVTPGQIAECAQLRPGDEVTFTLDRH